MKPLFNSLNYVCELSCGTLSFPQVDYHPRAFSMGKYVQAATLCTMLLSAHMSLLAID